MDKILCMTCLVNGKKVEAVTFFGGTALCEYHLIEVSKAHRVIRDKYTKLAKQKEKDEGKPYA